MTSFGSVPADPYPWPDTKDGSAANSALIIIDMQLDFAMRAVTSVRWVMT